jgi:hypothetical protein
MRASHSEPADQALALLSVAIGAIMEDEEVAAVSALPPGADERRARFVALGLAGRDIAALAAAAEVLLRRGDNL